MARSANYIFQNQNQDLIYWENRAPNINVTFRHMLKLGEYQCRKSLRIIDSGKGF